MTARAPTLTADQREALIDPLFNNNPIALQVLGICSALAVTNKLDVSFVMAMSVVAVTGCSGAAIGAELMRVSYNRVWLLALSSRS